MKVHEAGRCVDRGGKEQTEQSRKESWKVGEGGVEGEEGGRMMMMMMIEMIIKIIKIIKTIEIMAIIIPVEKNNVGHGIEHDGLGGRHGGVEMDYLT